MTYYYKSALFKTSKALLHAITILSLERSTTQSKDFLSEKRELLTQFDTSLSPIYHAR